MSISAVSSYSTSDMWQMRLQKDDSDGDGMVSKDEFFTAVANMPSNGMSSEDMFSKIDNDGDGYITGDEFSTFENNKPDFKQILNERASVNTVSSIDMWQKILESDDSNDDGSISQDEFLAGLANMQGAMTGMQIEQAQDAGEMFAELDSDGDGYITETEFGAMEASAPPPPPPPDGMQMSDSESTSSFDVFSQMLDNDNSENSFFQSLISQYQNSYSDLFSSVSITA